MQQEGALRYAPSVNKYKITIVMSDIKFNSQVCTTIQQSKRLLELGLKPETADMGLVAKICWGDNWEIKEEEREYRCCVGYEDTKHFYNNRNDVEVIPAWSLHRLIEIRFAGDNIGFGVYNIHNRNFGNCYEILISVIEYLIGIGEFNKEYLKQ